MRWVLIRLLHINWVMMRYSVVSSLLAKRSFTVRLLSLLNPWSWRANPSCRGAALRKSLEDLGPIFVKFGQVLSTRRDLFPLDIVDELAKLQDQVPPFSEQQAQALIEAQFQIPVNQLFKTFDTKPLASASIAQVHAARLKEGDEVVVKILRPHIKKIIQKDIRILYLAARLTEKFWKQGRRLQLKALVKEFEQTIKDELDLLREAANASVLRRNFEGSKMMYVPRVYWDYCKKNIMVIQRIYGIPIAEIDTLKTHRVNLKKLAEYGVEIFFTQVFRDRFFHADMHPGNLFVDISDPEKPRYCGVDFGIMGTLSPEDQFYLAENVMAFLERDYRRIALLHKESGWLPKGTHIDQFESAIRTICEPIFQKPLNKISFAHLLLRLFQTAQRFQMEIQPQLILLQKTLLNIEGLGRELYPELDVWACAKPILREWMQQRYSFKHLCHQLMDEFPRHLKSMIDTPELLLHLLKVMKDYFSR